MALEYVFSCHVQTNLYLTPPHAQGFPTHYDNHCVFVLQMEGEKAWRLYNKPVDTPYRGEEFQRGVHQPGALEQEFVLKAGDCAYIPRGMMHDAITSGEGASLHVTVGLITRTWADLMLEVVAEAALKNADARRSLPAGYANPGFDREPWRAYLRKLALALAQDSDLDPALDLTADAFIRSRAADNRGAVINAEKGVLETEKVRRHPFAPYRLAEDGDNLVLIAPAANSPIRSPSGRDLNAPCPGRRSRQKNLAANPRRNSPPNLSPTAFSFASSGRDDRRGAGTGAADACCCVRARRLDPAQCMLRRHDVDRQRRRVALHAGG